MARSAPHRVSAPLVSVVVPTHDHGPTLVPAVGSALRQTIPDLEVLIVGDGMPPAAAEVARALAREHERVRLFEFEKGARHGEAHRDQVIAAEARGRFVLYLSDDDLWLPEHAETLVAALATADFVGGTAAVVQAQGLALTPAHDLSRSDFRPLLLSPSRVWNAIPLSAAGHSRAAYLRSGARWSPAPSTVWTDLHFYRGLLADERISATSSDAVTCLHFAASQRDGMTSIERIAELERWSLRLEDAGELTTLRREFDSARRARAVEGELRAAEAHRALTDAHFEARHLRAKAADAELLRAGAQRRLEEIEASVTWRLGDRIRRTRLGRLVAAGLRGWRSRGPDRRGVR
jgi:GalNAc5-diNAcBac-PP-undecaprenol beta-1,3-glucosyltransferase